MRAALVIATTLIALFSDVSAAPPTTTISVTKTNRFTPAPLVTTPFTPEIDLATILPTQGPTGPIRKEHEQILIDLIANTPDKEAEEKADYLFRLGELYVKQTAFYRQQGDAAKTADFLAKTKTTYQRLLSSPAVRNYPKLDAALFFYASTLQAAKLPAEAKPIFDRLTKEIPNSKYVADAYLMIADAQYAAGKLAEADISYQKVYLFPRPQSSYARYMRGYIQLAQQKPAARQTFLELLAILRDDSKTPPPLLDATRTGVVRAMVQQNKIDLGVFTKSDHAVEDIENLALLYSARGKHERAAATYRELIKEQPANAKLCSWQLEAAKSTLAGLPVAAQRVSVCTTNVEAFKQWAKAAGLDVQ